MKIISNKIFTGPEGMEEIFDVTIDDKPAGFVLRPGPNHPCAANNLLPGVYNLNLVISFEFSKNQKYIGDFSETIGGMKLHRMIHFINPANPNAQHIYYHKGNKWQETKACLLAGTIWEEKASDSIFNGQPVVLESDVQYRKNYPIIHEKITTFNDATWEIKE